MKKVARILVPLIALAGVGAFVLLAGGAGKEAKGTKYTIIIDNAFGLTRGGDFKVGGVKAGKVKSFGLDSKNHAAVHVSVTEPGFGHFTSNAQCITRPQSIIGDWFIDCDPGKGGTPLKDGAVIPITHTKTSIPPDLVADTLRLPYRQRLSLIIGELGAGVAANGANINTALRRAIPALDQTDKLLKLLSSESQNINSLVTNADTVVTSLARNKQTVLRFVREAGRTAQLTAERSAPLRATFQRMPAFLTELKPSMVSLGKVADGQSGALEALVHSSGQVKRFFALVPPFAHASDPALGALARASRTGIPAVHAARPLVHQLALFARPTKPLSNNLRLVLGDLDNRNRAVETDPRAAQQVGTSRKVGYTGLEALLMYVFNQAVAINAHDKNGHLLRVNAFLSQCGPYADASDAKRHPECHAWVGPNQPGITSPDTSDKSLRGARASSTAARKQATLASRVRQQLLAQASAKSMPKIDPNGHFSVKDLPKLIATLLTPNNTLAAKLPKFATDPKNAAHPQIDRPKGGSPGDPSVELLNYLLSP